jgi:hypothetical protein
MLVLALINVLIRIAPPYIAARSRLSNIPVHGTCHLADQDCGAVLGNLVQKNPGRNRFEVKYDEFVPYEDQEYAEEFCVDLHYNRRENVLYFDYFENLHGNQGQISYRYENVGVAFLSQLASGEDLDQACHATNCRRFSRTSAPPGQPWLEW